MFGLCGIRFCGNVESEFETGCILWKQASERYSTSAKRSNTAPSIARFGYKDRPASRPKGSRLQAISWVAQLLLIFV
ncbi:MAG: hypothetical protein DMF09_05075 [Verrucomicrobia bacterium]|nr:MAG: hypothetical protein DMF09_05075 [Verrucomicrobiota bacterium]